MLWRGRAWAGGAGGEGRDSDCSPGIAVVSGEPGIGKTRLLAEVARRATERGFLVIEGRGAELERGVVYSVVIDAFDDYLAALDPRPAQRLAGDWAPIEHGWPCDFWCVQRETFELTFVAALQPGSGACSCCSTC
jgi:hypothetical protein